MDRLMKSLLHFFVAAQSGAQDKSLYEIARGETPSIQGLMLFLLVPVFVLFSILYLDSRNATFVLKNYSYRLLAAIVIMAIIYTTTSRYMKKYLPLLVADYAREQNRKASRWALRIFLVIAGFEYIGWMVYSCTRNSR